MPAVTIFMIMADLLRDMTKSTVKTKESRRKTDGLYLIIFSRSSKDIRTDTAPDVLGAAPFLLRGKDIRSDAAG